MLTDKEIVSRLRAAIAKSNWVPDTYIDEDWVLDCESYLQCGPDVWDDEKCCQEVHSAPDPCLNFDMPPDQKPMHWDLLLAGLVGVVCLLILIFLV